MNEFVIKKRWKFELSFYIIGLVLVHIYAPNYRYSFLCIPLIIGSVICMILEYRERYEEVVFGKFGITLPDGRLCKWENVRLIEFKRTSFFSVSLLIRTKNYTHDVPTLSYDFKFKKLKGYMMLNHPEIPRDSYIIQFIDGGEMETSKKRDVKVDDYVYEELERRWNKRKPKKAKEFPSPCRSSP